MTHSRCKRRALHTANASSASTATTPTASAATSAALSPAVRRRLFSRQKKASAPAPAVAPNMPATSSGRPSLRGWEERGRIMQRQGVARRPRLRQDPWRAMPPPARGFALPRRAAVREVAGFPCSPISFTTSARSFSSSAQALACAGTGSRMSFPSSSAAGSTNGSRAAATRICPRRRPAISSPGPRSSA